MSSILRWTPNLLCFSRAAQQFYISKKLGVENFQRSSNASRWASKLSHCAEILLSPKMRAIPMPNKKPHDYAHILLLDTYLDPWMLCLGLLAPPLWDLAAAWVIFETMSHAGRSSINSLLGHDWTSLKYEKSKMKEGNHCLGIILGQRILEPELFLQFHSKPLLVISTKNFLSHTAFQSNDDVWRFDELWALYSLHSTLPAAWATSSVSAYLPGDRNAWHSPWSKPHESWWSTHAFPSEYPKYPHQHIKV